MKIGDTESKATTVYLKHRHLLYDNIV